MAEEDKLKLIGIKEVGHNDELYLLVDFLNKTLKSKNLVFGLSLNDEGNMVISVYEM